VLLKSTAQLLQKIREFEWLAEDTVHSEEAVAIGTRTLGNW